jgi:glycosyltransferase involved in cell wall biosynthesis
MLKILHIIPSLRKGGAERLVLDICNELQNREDVKVKLVILHPENEYEFLSKNIDIQLCHSKVVPSITGKTLDDISDFERIVFDFGPKIIHSHLFEAEFVSRWRPIPGIRYITHCHDSMSQFRSFRLKTILNKALLTNFYERRMILKRYEFCNNFFIAISKDTESFFKENLPRQLKNNVVLMANAIDFKRFYKPENYTKDLNEISLVTVGSLIDRKNHIFLIEVVKRLHEKKINFRLDILGEGINRDFLERTIQNNNLADVVFLKGNVQNIEDYLQKAQIYVHAAKHEPFGLVLLEAMASGLPVICLDGKGNREIIEEGKNGYMIGENDTELFATKIIELVSDPVHYSEMSRYATEFAKGYDIKEYVDRLVEKYKSIALVK